MLIRFDIYESKYFTAESKIGDISMSHIPISGELFSFDTGKCFYLTNLLQLNTSKPEKNGEYFVKGSVIYMDNPPKGHAIELFIEKNNGNQDTFLYLKGSMPYLANEQFTKIHLIGSAETETKTLILPRTNLDYISTNGLYYEHDKAIYNQDGSITINVMNGIELRDFRDNRIR